MISNSKKRLGDLLVQAGKITKEQLKNELAKQRSTGIKLGELIVQDKILTEDDILDVLEIQLGIERVYLDMMELDKKAVRSIPESLALKYTLIAVEYENNKIKVAMSDPLNVFAVDDVSIATGKEVIPVMSAKKYIEQAIDKYYSSEYVEKAAEELSKSQVTQIKEKEIEDLYDVKNAPVVKLIDSIINNAVKGKASDIHIEPFERYLKIRYRIDGMLQEVLRISKENLSSLVTRIKILSNLDISEKRRPQDGRIISNVDDKVVDMRVSIMPTIHGEKVVIRLLHRDNFLLSKEQLGMTKEDIEKSSKIIRSPYGIVLVTGPTGSGKSTTLYTLLKELNNTSTNIITIEDPVEYMMEGVNQININPKAGLTFASGLRAMLRQDPDIIMIGEIRDNETAEIAVSAAITGHLVLSTIHTNDAASAVMRLEDMGIEPYLISTSLSGIIAQRLVKKICPKCKEEYIPLNYERSALGVKDEENIKLYKGKGCVYCNNTGYLGRIGVYEIMEITRKHRELIQNKKSGDEIREINKELDVKTLKDACVELVLAGETTMEELAKVAFLKE